MEFNQEVKNYVSLKALYNWAHKLLPKEAFNPVKQMSDNLSHSKGVSVVNVTTGHGLEVVSSSELLISLVYLLHIE
jgi:hypothetical protein